MKIELNQNGDGKKDEVGRREGRGMKGGEG